MINPDNKKELDKVPDIDKDDEPIYKIDESSKETAEKSDETPVFVKDSPEAPQGNEQDLKDEVSEE